MKQPRCKQADRSIYAADEVLATVLFTRFTPLRGNPTVAQIRQHADERTKRHKVMSCIQNSVSDVIFTRIMACESPKQAWDRLKEEFQGTEKTRQ
ncbi:putative LRR receptor-like serine/threonine-protein kinase [Gossypium australe]|uniref:Putative LRR receptor-like serine/threonine-protein kinase n=1 Tax=Gossypium australe TaxID=47621 RepID=A0A5B6VSF3_9ROSI|nr:putative LRR receptor-like serine/threonine-protein kinase [Gossypium australe]